MDELELDDILNHWIPQRLQTWSYPDPPEQDYIAGVVSIIETAIDDTASRISAKQQGMLELKRRQDLLALRLEGCKSLTAPIRKLPEDVLVDILRLGADFETLFTLRGSYDVWGGRPTVSWTRLDGSKSLSLVCSAWNTLIVNTANFWTKISVNFAGWKSATPLLDAELRTTFQEMFNTILERTRNAASLDITLTVFTSENVTWVPAISTLITPLLQEVHRWKRLCLELPTCQYADPGFNSFITGLSTLETLSIWATDGDDLDSQIVKHCNWFSAAPVLRDVTYMDIPYGLLDLPWGQLKRLAVELNGFAVNPHLDFFVEILNSAKQLQNLGFRTHPPEVNCEESGFLPSITSLNTYTGKDLQFLGTFTFSHLTEVILDVQDADMPSFLLHVSKTLQRLVITDFGGLWFPVTFFHFGICFPELIELSVTTTENLMPGEETQCIFGDVNAVFPKMSSFVCHANGDGAFKDWLTVFTWLSHSSHRIETSLTLNDTFQDNCIPILRDIASTVTKATALCRERQKPQRLPPVPTRPFKLERYLAYREERLVRRKKRNEERTSSSLS